MSPRKTHNIQFLLVDHMIATSATLASEMLRGAQNAADGLHRGQHQLNITTVGLTEKPVSTQAGIDLKPALAIDAAPRADIIYIPALWRNPRKVVQANADVLPWLQQAFAMGTTIAGVGTGCCFLAEAGLLDGKPATTHWHYFDRFEADYPKVQLKRDYFITQAGELYCAASVNSLADLTVHFIQQLYSSQVAHHIERHFSHEIRRAYESMRYFDGSIDKHADETILQTQLWLQDNYDKQFTFHQLAEQFDMSVRSFNRRFKNATGKSPLHYLQEIRTATARDLLQTSNLSISEIAYKVGYQDIGHFAALFKKFYSATPQEYRTTVRAKLFSM